MQDVFIIGAAVVSLVGIVLLILKLKVDPVIALVVGSLFLGLIAGLSPREALDAVITGFGDIMAEIGLLIAFGILLGALMSYLGAIEKLANMLLNRFGKKAMPYTFGLSMGVLLPSIFIDVLVVMVAPLIRSVAPKLGRNGVGRISSAVAVGLETGLALMVPGVAAVALAGLLDVPLGDMLIFGFLISTFTIVVTVFLLSILFRLGFWKPEKDEQEYVDPDAGKQASGEGDNGGASSVTGRPVPERVNTDGGRLEASEATSTSTMTTRNAVTSNPSLIVSMSPLLFALLLIAFGAISRVVGIENEFISFIGDPVFALLLGLIGVFIISSVRKGQENTERALLNGFRDSGQILVLTGVGGCLAATVQAIGLGDILEGYFSANAFAPVLLVWVLAATLHVAIGSVTTSAITAAGILAPLAASIGINPVLIALAAGAGSLFVIHVTSNTFWMMQSLFGQTTSGALKTVTVSVSIASVVGLVGVLGLSLFL